MGQSKSFVSVVGFGSSLSPGVYCCKWCGRLQGRPCFSRMHKLLKQVLALLKQLFRDVPRSPSVRL